MKLSVSLPYPTDDPVAESTSALALASALERIGVDAVAATDHPFPAPEPGRPGHQALDPFVLLSHLSGATEKLRLHFNLIVLPYRNPFLVARMIATLDILSGGRVIAAIGAGYMRKEFDALGARFDGRGPRLAEEVAAMRAAWTGEPVELTSDTYRVDGNVMSPRPLTQPNPPLWRGGNSRAAIESAVRHFDGWTPFEVIPESSGYTATTPMSIDILADQIRFLREQEASVGRTERLEICLVRTATSWFRDRSEAIEQLQRLDQMGVDWLTVKPYGSTVAEQAESAERIAGLVDEAGVRR